MSLLCYSVPFVIFFTAFPTQPVYTMKFFPIYTLQLLILTMKLYGDLT
jgi:hypothetical protein